MAPAKRPDCNERGWTLRALALLAEAYCQDRLADHYHSYHSLSRTPYHGRDPYHRPLVRVTEMKTFWFIEGTDFVFEPARNAYRCPVGQFLPKKASMPGRDADA